MVKEKNNESKDLSNKKNESKEKTLEKANVSIKKKSTAAYLSEETETQLNGLPNLEIANSKFLYAHLLQKNSGVETMEAKKIKEKLLEMIKKDNMSIYYKSLCEEFSWMIDTNFLSVMEQANSGTLQKLELQLKDAEENLGEIEILDLFLSHAFYYTRVGDSQKSVDILRDIYENKNPSLHQRIQIYFYLLRTNFFFIQSDVNQRSLPHALLSPKVKMNATVASKIGTSTLHLKTMINKCTQLIDEGGDWDYRNRLKVYEGLSCIINRNFKKAVQLLNESIATFTCTELITYEKLIFYCVLMNILTSDRQIIRKQLVDSSDVLMVLNEKPVLKNFLHGFYYGKYQIFFHSLVEIVDWIEKDMFLCVHKAFILRELRILAYDQYLNAYQSVTLNNMSNAFGLSSEFLDRELSYFISYGKINVKIDKVNGIIITNPKDRKNMKYNQIIKKGDLLLNRIQRLSRIVNV